MTTLNWQNTDIMTPEDMFLSVNLLVLGGKAKVFRDGRDKIAEATFVEWKHSGESRLYIATLEDGTEWEVVKLKCKCSDPAKSGRIWA